MNSYLEMLKRLGMGGNIPVSMGGSGMHPGMESGYQPTYGTLNQPPVLGVPQLGYKPVSNISTSTGAPMNKGIFGDIDWQQGIQDLAGMSFPTEEAGGMISGGRVGKGGPSLADFSPISMGGGAPNPGWPLVQPRRKEEQYAGPFVPTQMWS